MVPMLRFPEFRDAAEWEETPLKKLGDLVSGLTYSPDDVRDSGLLVLRSSNVQRGEITLDDNVYVTPSITGANLLKPNDILICVRNGSKDLIGKNALIPEDMPLCTHGAFMTVFRAQSARFVFQLFQSSTYQRQVDADLGATINSINGSKFLKYKFFVPNPHEQQKIASCLSSIDELITTQSQKVDALKTHKKALMQQLFATDGRTVPRFRFPEFRNAGDWDEKSLGQLIEIASGQVDPKQPPYRDFPQIGSENIESHSGKLVNVKSAGDKGVISGNYAFDENDILYSKIRPALNKVAAPTFTGICSADIYPIRPADCSLLRSYLFYQLLSQNFVDYAIRNSERGKIPKINRDALITYKTLIPSPAEQQRIASCLSSIDELITVQGQKLKALKTHKKGLMQQLFPVTDMSNAGVDE